MFPSIISTFNVVSPTDRLNSPSHSALHNSVSSVLTQVQTVIGLSTSSALGSLMYDIRSPNSNGGGHVQTANKGGTGQTSYTKGDLLVATSSSVLAKLAVSSVSGDVLVADPNQSGGMKWAPVISNKVAINTASVSLARGAASALTVLYSASILGSTLGTNNGIKFTGQVPLFEADSTVFTLIVNLGANSVLTINTEPIPSNGSVVGSGGTFEGVILANGSASAQVGYATFSTRASIYGGFLPNIQAYGYGWGTSSVNSSANQNLVITGQYAGVQTKNSILAGSFIVEKIA